MVFEVVRVPLPTIVKFLQTVVRFLGHVLLYLGGVLIDLGAVAGLLRAIGLAREGQVTRYKSGPNSRQDCFG